VLAAVVWIIVAVASGPTAADLRVTGVTACPSPREVEQELAGLIGPREAESVPDLVELRDDAGSIVVALRRGSGEVIAEKRLDAGLSCAQRAAAAAVVVAAWEARPGSQAASTLAVPAPAQVAPPTVVVTHEPAPRPIHLEPGVSLGLSLVGSTPTPAALVEVAFARTDAVIPGVAALVVGSHSTPVGPGDGNWRRFGLLATAGSRRSWSRTFAEARIGVALTLLDISGSSFARNGSGLAFDPGIPIGARVGLRTAAIRWWLDATVALWPRGQTLYLEGAPGSASLPRGEALLGLGASFDRR